MMRTSYCVNSLQFGLLFTLLTLLFVGTARAQETKQMIRIAKLEIDPLQLESYKVALKAEIETSVRVEPGVLTLYAVYDKNNPAHVTVFEIYADEEAYKLHIQSSHFKKYKDGTKDMVKSLELSEVVPIALKTKGKL